jgi:hypothetical protein
MSTKMVDISHVHMIVPWCELATSLECQLKGTDKSVMSTWNG